jgi:hypothetical protein
MNKSIMEKIYHKFLKKKNYSCLPFLMLQEHLQLQCLIAMQVSFLMGMLTP